MEAGHVEYSFRCQCIYNILMVGLCHKRDRGGAIEMEMKSEMEWRLEGHRERENERGRGEREIHLYL